MIHKRPKKSFRLWKANTHPARPVRKFAVSLVNRDTFQLPVHGLLYRIIRLFHTVSAPYLAVVLSLTLTIFLMLVFIHYYFSVTEIAVVYSDANASMRSYAIDGLSELRGKNILFQTNESIRAHILSLNPGIIDVGVEKEYPQKITIRIQPDPIVGHISLNQHTYATISSRGYVLGLVYERPLYGGIIHYYQDLSPADMDMGKSIGIADIRFATSIGAVLVRNGYGDYVIDIKDTHLVTTEIEGVQLRFSADADLSKQIAELEHMLKIIQNGATNIRMIDLRFEKIIIEKY